MFSVLYTVQSVLTHMPTFSLGPIVQSIRHQTSNLKVKSSNPASASFSNSSIHLNHFGPIKADKQKLTIDS